MAWETAIDRLFVQQIHRAEKGELRADDVQRQLNDLHQLAPSRPETAFLLGYGRVVLGVDLAEPAGVKTDLDLARWYTFGRLRGHDRRGERNWVADLLGEPAAIMDLLRDPKIAAQCLPLVMRTLFWCGDLDLAVQAIGFLATDSEDTDAALLVDAALADLLTRLENRVDEGDDTSTLSILQKCVGLECFGRLPADVRARYLRALAQRLLAVSEFDDAEARLREALTIPTVEHRLGTSISVLGTLAELRLHEIEELAPQAERPERATALEWIASVRERLEDSAPDALFAHGILSYEVADYETAANCFDAALKAYRRISSGRDSKMIERSGFFLAAALLASGNADESSRALRLISVALETVAPDLESFYSVHEALKERDRKLALRFLDAVDLGRGTAPDQLLFVALEYLSLGESDPAMRAAERVLGIAVDLDQRIEAQRVLLTAHNMRGDRAASRGVYESIRDMLVQRGKFEDLEKLLQNEDFVGQALDHLDIKCELVDLYEQMDDREYEKAQLQTTIARNLRARKETDAFRQAHAILREVEIGFPELATDELRALEKLLALDEAAPIEDDAGAATSRRLAERLGRPVKVLVVGGNERQRRHHPRFEQLVTDWAFDGEWLMANYTSPQKLVATISDRIDAGLDLLILLHWNRHETTEPALELARRASVPARTVHYAGFTSLQVSLADQLEKLEDASGKEAVTAASGGGSGGKTKGRRRAGKS